MMAVVFLIVAICYAVAIGSTAILLHVAPKFVDEPEITLVQLEEIAPELFRQSKNESVNSY